MSADKPIKRRIRKPAGKAPRPSGARAARPGEATGARKPGAKGKGPNFAKPPRSRPAADKSGRSDTASRRGQQDERRGERRNARRDERHDGDGRDAKRPTTKFVRRARSDHSPDRERRDAGDRRPQTAARDERRDGGRVDSHSESRFVRRDRAPRAPDRDRERAGSEGRPLKQSFSANARRAADRHGSVDSGNRSQAADRYQRPDRQKAAGDLRPVSRRSRDERPQREDQPRRDARPQSEDRPQHGARPQRDQRPQREARPQREGRAPSVRTKPNQPLRPGAVTAARKPSNPGRRKTDESELPALNAGGPVRIAKAMARAGLCSRRDAERWIEEGRVSVNGRILTTPAFEVGPKDKVLVDGQPLPAVEPPQLWRYYKPRGVVTTHADPQGRPTVFDSLPEELPRVVSIGRLDFNSEGLLLLTNDGRLARYMELPSTGWLRRYRARAHGRVTQDLLDRLQDGIEIDGVRYGPVEASVDSVQGANTWLTVSIREGKNREVRRILAHLGLEVNRLIRISYGPFQLLDLKPGEAEVVRRRVLADQLGPRLAEQFDLGKPADTEREKRQARNKKAD